MLTDFGKPDPSVFAKFSVGEEKSGRFKSRTKFDSSSRLILHANTCRTAILRKKKHYLEVAICRGGGGGLALKRKMCAWG